MTAFLNDVENKQVNLIKRPRRNRKTPAIRDLIQETRLHPHQLIAPLFVMEGENKKQEIASMPGVFRLSLDLLAKEVMDLYNLGIRAVNLFPVIPSEKKDPQASEALREDNLLARSLAFLKKEIPQMCLMCDIALDPYTSHGHDGLIDREGNILNDETLDVLAGMSLIASRFGADVIAPSDMMDGRIGFLRSSLDESGYSDVSILSYAAKYASSFYGPFRDALGSAPKFGDKKTYQMNPANAREAMLEVLLDEQEGADMLLIKPALAYLDIILLAKQRSLLPVGAYHVSGEYAMCMAAAEKGWLDEKKVFYESLLSMKRAGADFILTYAAAKVAKMLKDIN